MALLSFIPNVLPDRLVYPMQLRLRSFTSFLCIFTEVECAYGDARSNFLLLLQHPSGCAWIDGHAFEEPGSATGLKSKVDARPADPGTELIGDGSIWACEGQLPTETQGEQVALVSLVGNTTSVVNFCNQSSCRPGDGARVLKLPGDGARVLKGVNHP